jgi:hypothetical protein
MEDGTAAEWVIYFKGALKLKEMSYLVIIYKSLCLDLSKITTTYMLFI